MAKNSGLSDYIKDMLITHHGDRIKRYFVNAYEDMLYDIYDDAFQLYAKAIDQYYLYETTSYIRHGEGKPGTKKGTNLHEANKTHISGHLSSRSRLEPSKSCQVMIRWSSDGMYPYKKVSTDYVLSNVLKGIRGTDPETARRYNAEGNRLQLFSEPWGASIRLPHSHMALSGSPLAMLEDFLSQSKRACRRLMDEHLKLQAHAFIASLYK